MRAVTSSATITTMPNHSKALLGSSSNWMVIRNFVSRAECDSLLCKAYEHMRRHELHPNPCGPGRFFAKADESPEVYVDSLIERLTRRCECCLQLAGTPSDCVLGRTISLILPGGFIHRHTDAYRTGQPGHRPCVSKVELAMYAQLHIACSTTACLSCLAGTSAHHMRSGVLSICVAILLYGSRTSLGGLLLKARPSLSMNVISGSFLPPGLRSACYQLAAHATYVSRISSCHCCVHAQMHA